MGCSTVVFTHIILFHECLQNEADSFLKTYVKIGYHLYHHSCHLVAKTFSEQTNLRKKITVVVTFYKKGGASIYGKKAVSMTKEAKTPYKRTSRDNAQIRNKSPLLKLHVTIIKEKAKKAVF